MSQVFTYDVATLIELIESKPCLRDKTRGYVFKERVKASFQNLTANIGCIQYCLSRFLYFRLRYKSTSKLRFLFLCTNIFLVQHSISNWPPAAVMPVCVENSTTGARSDSGKKLVYVQVALHSKIFACVQLQFSSGHHPDN
jgi:hypothetical protein